MGKNPRPQTTNNHRPLLPHEDQFTCDALYMSNSHCTENLDKSNIHNKKYPSESQNPARKSNFESRSPSPFTSHNCFQPKSSPAPSMHSQSINPASSPASSGAKQLNKLKRFLTTLQQFAADISPEISERVRNLVLNLIVSLNKFFSRLFLTKN